MPSFPPGDQPTPGQQDIPQTTVIAQNLEVPWDLVFLPDKSMLVTERPGRVRIIDSQGNLQEEPVLTLQDVLAEGEGGLLGITIHPNFSQNNYVYLYYTYARNGQNTQNRVVRYTYTDNQFRDRTVLIDNIPGALFHNGGRLRFGPDSYLYITTGDAQEPSLAQNPQSLAGKILRVTDDGDPAPDNPFNNAVYSYGHRNPQGLAWDNQKRLWATEHGSSTMDELNLIEKGANYGWPVIRGTQTRTGMISPVLQSDSTTWAPAGTVFLQNSIYFAGLRGTTLYQAKINGNQATLSTHFEDTYGRLRAVVLGPDNMLYITTSNRDGRGFPTLGDDKIIRVNPEKL